MCKKTSVVIIDDDPAAIASLRQMLNDYPDMNIVGEAKNAADGRALVKSRNPQLLFLDIELPDANGVELMEEFGSENPSLYIVMFTAVYDQYAEEAFNRYEKDYLLKPIQPKELDKTIQRFRHASMDISAVMPQVPVSFDAGERLAVLTFTNEMRVMRVQEVGYFRYSTRRKVWEVCLNDHSFITLKKGTSAGDILSYSKNFAQTHQSFIVNMENVMLIGAENIVLYPPFDNEEVAIGRTYRKSIQERFTCI